MIKTEQKRLEVVQRFLDLKINKEKELKDIVKLAAEICQTPIALITLMDADIQYIKFAEGTDAVQNSRENSFCRYLVDKKEIMEVPDTLKDKRFVNNPFVVDQPNLRFYAGAPLTTHDDQHLGTLCVFDNKPKQLTAKQKEMLEILSRQVLNIMELELNDRLLKTNMKKMRIQNKKMAFTEFKLQSFFESSAICHVLVGKQLQILFFNKQYSQTIQQLQGRPLACGKKLSAYLSPAMSAFFTLNVKRALAGETIKEEYLASYTNRESIWWDLEFTPAFNVEGKVIGVSINAVNITDRKLQVEKITIQNAALKKIAQMQSHEFRPTVANIIGLMNIIKENGHLANNQYMHLMEESIKELDKKIRAVVSYAVLIPEM